MFYQTRTLTPVPAAPRLTIIFNPIAGRRRRGFLEDVTDRLTARGWAIELQATARRGDAERLARAIVRMPKQDRPDLLAVAGGDGTIGEAINGLVTAVDADAMPFGIIPMGTANVLAAEIGLAVDAAAIAATLDARQARRVHVGLANGRAFSLMVGAGFDAHVVAGVDPAMKKRLGKLAYMWQALREARRFPYPTYRVSIDGGDPIEAASVIVAKGRYYGGRHVVAPAADLGKAGFEICLFERRGIFQVLRYGLALALGCLPRTAGYAIASGSRVEITGPIDDPVQGDGDIIGRLPMRIALAPIRLRLIMPRRDPTGTRPA
ncbi:YegS/Rv2252/BmrU family lipid kinase [Dongia mobilis]|uniref:YegS/Rv2252/BmrU family lipid kinase n=1 Tax=Dongia mobilis TaxID=578943 RepID=A0A4R6WT94_9PROT|nr:YegS/Rv2252/BmrU family lipid kinase [Dongia mobilis]TDQ82304.1 YegS/Rv2252/BmrU family lipid kinase [Dongia mobilis]